MTARAFIDIMEGIRVKHDVGRPGSKPIEVHADQAYDTKEIRRYLRRRGIKREYQSIQEIDVNQGWEDHTGSIERPISA